MSTSQGYPPRYVKHHAMIGLALFTSALFYYFVFRHNSWVAQLPSISDFTAGAYPSFAFCLSAGLLCSSLLWRSRTHAIIGIIGVLTITLTLEVSMGTFDWLDVYAASLGSLIALLALARFNTHAATKVVANRSHLNIRTLTIWLGSFWLATGSYYAGPDCAYYEGNTCIEYKTFKAPVYMSYNDLRSSVRMGSIREMSSVSRIYLYKSLILVNEQNEGVHIIDNRFPANPKRIAFIEIPGNTEISVKNDYLYADSYVDLVTLSLADTDNVVEVAREQDIFPYDEYQNIPYNVEFEFGLVDRNSGVVVGYK